MNKTLSPVVLFVYNRPALTKLTLESLSKNELAPESTLYIYCDGPKEGASFGTIQEIRDVRSLVKEHKWCKEVYIVEYENNRGLKDSIINGVNDVLNRYGQVIVLEDDIITSPAFLTYMNKALVYYRERRSVFSICAYNLPSNRLNIPSDYTYDVYVSLRNFSWGWGTWKDRWDQVEWDLSIYDQLASDKSMITAFNRSGEDVFPMLCAQKNGRLNIWSIQFTLAHFVNHAISIAPVISYVDNIGLDGSGENCHPEPSLRNHILNVIKNPNFLEILYEDKRIINSYYSAFYPFRRPIWQKIINKVSRVLGGRNKFTLKKKVYC